MILEGIKNFGEKELVDGKAMEAVKILTNAIIESSGDQIKKSELQEYLLTYALYAYSSLPLLQISSIYSQYYPCVTNEFKRQLLRERFSSLLRYEREMGYGLMPAQKSIFMQCIRDEVLDSQICPVYVVSPPQNNARFIRLFSNAFILGYKKMERRGIMLTGAEQIPHWIRFDAQPGIAGCIISHLEIWKEIVQRKIEYALILEDDVVLTAKPIDFHQLPPRNLDILFVNNRVIPDYRLVDRDVLDDTYQLLPVCGGAGMDGYYIFYEGAKKLVELFENVTAQVDLLIMAHQKEHTNLPVSKVAEEWEQIRRTRQSDIRLHCARLYPFFVDHPPANYSVIHNDFRRHYAPGLWAQE